MYSDTAEHTSRSEFVHRPTQNNLRQDCSNKRVTHQSISPDWNISTVLVHPGAMIWTDIYIDLGPRPRAPFVLIHWHPSCRYSRPGLGSWVDTTTLRTRRTAVVATVANGATYIYIYRVYRLIYHITNLHCYYVVNHLPIITKGQIIQNSKNK